ncbi:MAG: hypothetical protein ABUJ92_15475 [Desulfobacterales bacterium]
MDENILTDVWNVFALLENEFNNIDYDLPMIQDNFDIWSLRLGDILLRSGSIFDSFLSTSINDSELEGHRNITAVRAKKTLNISDYEKVFNRFYGLSKEAIYVKSLKRTIKPLADWSSRNKSPEWWKEGYNKLKHDRFKNRQCATLKRTLYALASIFLVLIKHIPSRMALVSFKAIQSEPPSLRWHVKELLYSPSGDSSETCVAESTLFSYVFTDWTDRNTEEAYRKHYDPFMQPD